MDDIHLTAALLRSKLKELLERSGPQQQVHRCEIENSAEALVYTESQVQQLLKTASDKAKAWKELSIQKENEELQIKIDHAYTQLQRSQQQVKALQAENRDLKTRLLEQSRVSEDAKRAADEYENYIATIQSNFEAMKSSFSKLQDQFHQCKAEINQTHHVLEHSCSAMEDQQRLLDEMRRDMDVKQERLDGAEAELAMKEARLAASNNHIDTLKLQLASSQDTLRMHQGLAKQADLYVCQLQLQYDDIMDKYLRSQDILKGQNSKLDEALALLAALKTKDMAIADMRKLAEEETQSMARQKDPPKQDAQSNVVTFHSAGVIPYVAQQSKEVLGGTRGGAMNAAILLQDAPIGSKAGQSHVNTPAYPPSNITNIIAQQSDQRLKADGDVMGAAVDVRHAESAMRKLDKPAKISSLCPECKEEAFGLMVACRGCGSSFHSNCARKISERTNLLSINSCDTTRQRSISKLSSALLSAYRCENCCLQTGA